MASEKEKKIKEYYRTQVNMPQQFIVGHDYDAPGVLIDCVELNIWKKLIITGF